MLLWLDTANYGTYISTLEYFCQEQMLMISASEMIVAILINVNVKFREQTPPPHCCNCCQRSAATLRQNKLEQQSKSTNR